MPGVEETRVPVKSPVLVTPVQHGTRVRMSPAGGRRAEVTGVRSGVTHPVDVVRDGIDVGVGIGVEMLSGLTTIPGSLNDMVQMRDHTYRNKGVAVIVECDTPGVTGPVRENFKLMPGWVIAEHPGVKPIRSSSGVPGLPILECVNTPCVPYSQPSGPQVKVLRVSCVSWYPKPSNRICGSPAGASPDSSMGMNIR